ncbi:hypothetical protein FOA52_000568 [Chlamydomonas sp. UWO 241]|nr:hypothetical protein FOA52_000568 [Chlamydomonas sp. UWO 241]
MPHPLLLLASGLLLVAHTQAYYVPGTYPEEFREGDVLQAKVNSLKSFETEMPYEYYTMPFCKPPEGVQTSAMTTNPGTILEGLRIENSVYNFSMRVQQRSVPACVPQGFYGPLTKSEVDNLKEKIDDHYRINMLLDNLPITTYDLLDANAEYVRPGFELGYKDPSTGKYYIYNHIAFNILITLTHGEYMAARQQADVMALLDSTVRRHLSSTVNGDSSSGSGASSASSSGGGVVGKGLGARRGLSGAEGDAKKPPFFMIVGFEVAPCSVQRIAGEPLVDVTCNIGAAEGVPAQEIIEGQKIVYTYDVDWQETDIKWASRWDAYLRMPGGQVHWFSILNSCLVVLVTTSIVAVILIRTVRRDLAKYEQLVMDTSMDRGEESGWKLVKGDAFRPPAGSRMLAVAVGSGVQIILTTAISLLLATLGFLSPAARGALLTTSMVLYVWLAFVAGFAAVLTWGMVERSYNGWPTVCARTSVTAPGIVMAIFTLLNMVIHHTGTTGAVPVGMYFALVLVWFAVSIPLAFVGGYAALRVPIPDLPMKTNQIPRHVPPPPVGTHPWVLFFAAGLLPFTTIFIELYFAMTSIWLGYFYYLFGFMFLVGLLATFVTAEISVLCTYTQLCTEDYHWWWSSFHRGGSVAMYTGLYALMFLFASLPPTVHGALPAFIYLCYMAIVLVCAYFAMGTVGFLASYGFVYYVFKALKSD